MASSTTPPQTVVGGRYNLTTPTLASGDSGETQLDSRGGTKVVVMGADSINGVVAAAASDAQGSAFTALLVMSENLLFNGTTFDRARGDTIGGAYVQAKPVTSGGLLLARIVTGTTGVIKASAGQMYGLNAYNANAALRWLHLYNKATAPTLSTDTPLWSIALPPTSQVIIPCSAIGEPFAAGIAWAYTTDNIAIPATAGTSAELLAGIQYF